MKPRVHCPEWEEKLSLYVDGVLNPFDENAVEAHIARCASCRATVELWRAVGQSVRRLPRELPPPYLREAILASTTRRRSRAPLAAELAHACARARRCVGAGVADSAAPCA